LSLWLKFAINKTGMKIKNYKISLTKDLIIIIFSLLIAYLLAKSNLIENFVGRNYSLRFLDSFLAGIFFVSVFTTAPALVAILEIAQKSSILFTALFGALGALLGDLIVFRFIKNSLNDDFFYLLKLTGLKRLSAIFRAKIFRWLTPLIGALIIASPLPDELGLAMMGFSKIKTKFFVLISFGLNFIGILAVILIVKRLQGSL